MPRQRLLVIVAVIALAAGVYRISAPWRVEAIDVVAVRRGRLVDTLAVTGTVEARTVAIAPKVPGRVRAVHVDVGSEVAAGQVLVELESDELAAQVDEATAALAAARARENQATAALALQGATWSARVAQSQAELAAARAQRDKARGGARPQEREQAAARVQQARVALDQAKRELERARELVSRGALPASALDAARAEADGAQARYDAAVQARSLVEAGAQAEDLAAADARVRQAEAAVAAVQAAKAEERMRVADLASARAAVRQARAALRAAQTRLDATRLIAPISGTVVRKSVEVGELLAPGPTVLTLGDLRETWVTVDLAAGDVAKVRLHQPLDVRSDAYPGRVFPGKVSELSRVADPRFGVGQAWSIRAKVALTDPERVLRPGVQVDLTGEGVLATDALLVPSSAVVARGEVAGVFVVEAGVARFREVEVGVKTARQAQIVRGVSAGEQVMVSPGEGLRDGTRVRVK